MMRAAAVAMVVAALLAGCAPTSRSRCWHRPRSILPRTIAMRRSSSSGTRCRRIPTWRRRASCSGKSLLETGDLLRRREGAAQGRASSSIRPTRSFRRWRAFSCARRLQEGARRVRDGRDDVAGGQSRPANVARPGADGDRQCRGRRAADFAAALAAQPGYPPALLGEARLKAAAGDLPGALALVEAALAKDRRRSPRAGS